MNPEDTESYELKKICLYNLTNDKDDFEVDKDSTFTHILKQLIKKRNLDVTPNEIVLIKNGIVVKKSDLIENYFDSEILYIPMLDNTPKPVLTRSFFGIPANNLENRVGLFPNINENINLIHSIMQPLPNMNIENLINQLTGQINLINNYVDIRDNLNDEEEKLDDEIEEDYNEEQNEEYNEAHNEENNHNNEEEEEYNEENNENNQEEQQPLLNNDSIWDIYDALSPQDQESIDMIADMGYQKEDVIQLYMVSNKSIDETLLLLST